MNKEFATHMLNEVGKAKAQAIAHAFDACLEALSVICPPGREMALARTKLEEACFFAKAWTLRSGHAVVLLEGRTGGYALDALEPQTKASRPTHLASTERGE